MWFDPGLIGLFITSTLLHLREDINSLVVSQIKLKNQRNTLIKKKHQTHTVIFEKIQKPFYFKKINIKTFTKHLINSNKQLKLKLNKENQHFMH